jgi:hypothetical protein
VIQGGEARAGSFTDEQRGERTTVAAKICLENFRTPRHNSDMPKERKKSGVEKRKKTRSFRNRLTQASSAILLREDSPPYQADGDTLQNGRTAPPPIARLLERKKLIPFGWYGGKFSHLDWLLPLLPDCHHYCEPFAGSGAVLLNREPSPMDTSCA